MTECFQKKIQFFEFILTYHTGGRAVSALIKLLHSSTLLRMRFKSCSFKWDNPNDSYWI